MVTRILSGIIGFPIVAILLIFGNQFIIDMVFSLVAIICLYEFYNSFKVKELKPITWVGYVIALGISFIHMFSSDEILFSLKFIIPIVIIIFFIQSIITKMKYSIIDIAVSLLGILYIVGFIIFIPMIRGLNDGKFYIWYLLFCSWGADTFAYFTGMAIGKHKFSKISPKKTIEGCFGGIIGATLLCIAYTYFLNKYSGLNLNYMYILIMSAILSILSEIGDLAASSIKRYTGIKDFGNIIPGHGGILDRIDSLIFIAPIMYLFFII